MHDTWTKIKSSWSSRHVFSIVSQSTLTTPAIWAPVFRIRMPSNTGGLEWMGNIPILAVQRIGSMASLGHHILRIVSSGPREQVVRTHARPHIAAMANLHAIRNRPVNKFPSQAMSIYRLLSSDGESWVPIGRSPSPYPTASKIANDQAILIHHVPEPLLDRPIAPSGDAGLLNALRRVLHGGYDNG